MHAIHPMGHLVKRTKCTFCQCIFLVLGLQCMDPGCRVPIDFTTFFASNDSCCKTRTHAGKGFERPHALLSQSLARIHVFDFCAWIMKRNNHSSCDSSIKWLMMQTIIVMQIQAGTSYLAGTCFACDRFGSRQNSFVCVWSMDHNCNCMIFSWHWTTKWPLLQKPRSMQELYCFRPHALLSQSSMAMFI